MKKLTIDINDVYRDFTGQLVSYYRHGIDKAFDIDNLDYTEDNVFSCLPFDSIEERNEFLFEDYPYEIFACGKTMNEPLPAVFNMWLTKLTDFEGEQPVVSFTATGESNLAIQSTLYFLSKTSTRVRKITFPQSSKEVWEDCDILITANPILLETKPEGKTVIKIETEYNSSCDADYTFKTLNNFLENEDLFLQLLELDK